MGLFFNKQNNQLDTGKRYHIEFYDHSVHNKWETDDAERQNERGNLQTSFRFCRFPLRPLYMVARFKSGVFFIHQKKREAVARPILVRIHALYLKQIQNEVAGFAKSLTKLPVISANRFQINGRRKGKVKRNYYSLPKGQSSCL